MIVSGISCKYETYDAKFSKYMVEEDAKFMIHKVNFADDDMPEIKLFIVCFVRNTLKCTITMCSEPSKPSEWSLFWVYRIKMISYTDAT